MKRVSDFTLVSKLGRPVVAMTVFKDRVFVATTDQVFELHDGIFHPMVFAVPAAREDHSE